MKVPCSYCDRPARLVMGREIYRHLHHLRLQWFWLCEPCDAYVGCHRKGCGQGYGTKPLGRLANAQLRRAKMAAHDAFDPLWKSGRMARGDAYAWLAGQLGISVENCHIGMFDVDGCNAVVAAVEARRAP